MSRANTFRISPRIYRIRTFLEDRNLGFNQYLLLDRKNALVHTGTVQMFKGIMEAVRNLIRLQDLNYVVISHFESDECGSLGELLKLNPDLIPVSSEVTARQLMGFGIHNHPRIVGEGDKLDLGEKVLRFIDYPSEMHLWSGILAYEQSRNVLFSGDLFIQRGKEKAPITKRDIPALMEQIDEERIPSEKKRKQVIAKLLEFNFRIIAPGHGPVLKSST